jgi:hypothetical protein
MFESVIIIQKYIRRYLIKKKILIPDSCYQTKIWRKNRNWYKNGKSNECEKYQIDLIEKIIQNKLQKTNDRLDTENNEIVNIRNINSKENAYEFTENFDGVYSKNENIYYFNLKFVCDIGGAQARTLREVYHFIKYQAEYKWKHPDNKIYFVNILDGDTSYNNTAKYFYLIDKEKYKDIRKFIFIGSLFNFQKYKFN